MKKPIAVIIHYRSKPETADTAVTELSKLITTVRESEPACLAINLHVDEDDPTRILLYERWLDRESYFGDHMNTPHLKVFRERAVGFIAEMPTITVWHTEKEV